MLHGLKEELQRNRRHTARRQGRNTTATAARGGPSLGEQLAGGSSGGSGMRRRSASLGEHNMPLDAGPSAPPEALCVPDLSTLSVHEALQRGIEQLWQQPVDHLHPQAVGASPATSSTPSWGRAQPCPRPLSRKGRRARAPVVWRR